ncbi:Uma2 family endonuclease [Mucilaginibacter polytrichastri]|uniref:Uma2 family endonuclease n=1 Tax=Mucilaginibacter polytrichastri TaxID=1302689 RepID=UPI0008E761B6|nr:Uma2 family endonuclease [Mucilaginibacter polytrichastri]SFT13354.1 Putative restriction endonuclease [Mucilaginibacter polytrichastri]
MASQIQVFSKENISGKVFVAPCDVYLNDEQNVVQPDILFIKKERESIIQNQGIYGAPDLIIEILSTNKIHDQERKLELYRQNLVPEYIIDPETKDLWHYLLKDNRYIQKSSDKGKLFIEQISLELIF